ncbi:MAG: sigma-70 family RNA polymerase sigma factor [Anaerolineae bacterium]|nr:sigma-70 family RNA polymerase sigma factor [Anaerolineae bacterium]
MTKYDPAFWEVSVDPAILEAVLVDVDSLEALFITPEEAQTSATKAQHKQEAIALIQALIQMHLTPRQQQIIQLYFYDHKTQQEIATELGIPQQVVSKHLFGVLRDGRKIGGALKKLRKLCEASGIDPEKWV